MRIERAASLRPEPDATLMAGPTLLELAARVEGLDPDATARDVDALNVEILRALTGRPWRAMDEGERHSMRVVTWDSYGPGATGNPACAMPRYTSDLSETLMSLSMDPDARAHLWQRREDGAWCARVENVARALDVPGHASDDVALAALSALLRYRAARAPATPAA